MTKKVRWWALVALLCAAAIGSTWGGPLAAREPDARQRDAPEVDRPREAFPAPPIPDELSAPGRPLAHAAAAAGDDPGAVRGARPTVARSEHAELHGSPSPMHTRASCDVATTLASRSALLRSFEEHRTVGGAHGGSVLASPELDPAVARHTFALLNAEAIPRRVDLTLGTRSRPVDVVLYRDVTQLRGHSCVRAEAVAFYDGAIHLAWDGDFRELETSLTHELVHHALASIEVDVPIWLHEGAALTVSGEQLPTTRAEALPLDTMVHGFSGAASEREVARFYEQAQAMVSFLRELLRFRAPGTLEPLVLALVEGQADAPSLFEWAARQWVADLPSDPPSFTDDYWNRRGGLGDAWTERFRARLHTPPTDLRTLVHGGGAAAR